MRLWIPKCGFRLVLASDWTFDLYAEHRNQALFDSIGTGVQCKYYTHEHVQHTLKAGTVLEVDRVYIRSQNKGVEDKDGDYDSLTFRIIEKAGSVRFWAKLVDVNTIEYELPTAEATAEVDQKKERAKVAKLNLEAAKDHVRSICAKGYDSRFWKHVKGIIEAVCKVPLYSGFTPQEEHVRSNMNHAWHSSYGDWAAVKSMQNPDGTTTREIRYRYNGKSFAGFTVVSRGAEIVSTAELT